ncbi:MAG TPA: GAF domain-containing protein, partial [Dyadobacter sp.]|nr:GAF domain-containing protein [Dyadobacter sp.]
MEKEYVLSENGITDSMQNRIDSLERDRAILLDLGNDITRVREKSDLITLFSSRLKHFFYFNHAVVTLIEPGRDQYRLFLYDEASAAIRNHSEFGDLVVREFPLNEPFIQNIIDGGIPQSFLLESVMNQPGAPRFLRINYETGMKAVLITPLRSKLETIGFLNIYSDRSESFTDEFRTVLKGIAGQLSSAVSNISANEEILAREREKSFLLDFSQDIASVRTKADLETAISSALQRLLNTRLAMIRVIEDDGQTLTPYLWDISLFSGVLEMFEQLTYRHATLEEYFFAQVLA